MTPLPGSALHLWVRVTHPFALPGFAALGYLFNRSSGRVLTAVPTTGGQPPQVVTASPGSQSALQLWTAMAAWSDRAGSADRGCRS